MVDEHIPLPQDLIDLFARNQLTISASQQFSEVHGEQKRRFCVTITPTDTLLGRSLSECHISLQNSLLACMDDIHSFILPRWMSVEDCHRADAIIRAMEDRLAELPSSHRHD